jgi:hypothetical protein
MSTPVRPDAPPAPVYAPPKKKMGKGKWALIVIGGLIVLGAIGNAVNPKPPPGTNPGLGTNDASADLVGVSGCDSSYGIVTCTLTLTNHSSGTSNYYVEATLTDSSGVNVGMANALASNVAPGQTAKTDISGPYTGSDTNLQVKVITIQRTSA